MIAPSERAAQLQVRRTPDEVIDDLRAQVMIEVRRAEYRGAAVLAVCHWLAEPPPHVPSGARVFRGHLGETEPPYPAGGSELARAVARCSEQLLHATRTLELAHTRLGDRLTPAELDQLADAVRTHAAELQVLVATMFPAPMSASHFSGMC